MYIDDGGGEPASKSIMNSMVEFAKTAAEGGFEISKEGAAYLITAIDNFQDWIDQNSHVIGLLEQERKLGASNGAKVIGPFMQEIAGDDQGFITQMKALRASLKEAKKGIELAVAAYEKTEAATHANLKNIKS